MFEFLNPNKKKINQVGLKIIIVGCGKVGITLVERLSQEGHDIAIIDQEGSVVTEIANLYDVMGIVGNGASYSVQMEAGIDQADLIIAVTESDELNLLCCTIARRVGHCAAIARVRTPDYNIESDYLRDKLDLAMIINPELEASREMARILYLPSALEVNSFAHGQAEIIKFQVPEGNIMNGKTVSGLRKEMDSRILVCAIERDGDVYIPDGDSVIHENDILSIVATREETIGFFDHIGFKTNQVKNTMIVGGGKAAYYLGSQLIKMGISVKIIEIDKARCEKLSILLPKAVIINGDGTDQDLLEEEGIQYAESFVPLTGIDEENILLTLYARQVSQAKVITKINRINFKSVISKLDLGSVLYPRYITSEAIIAYVRAKTNSTSNNIETLYHMFDHRVEAIEFHVAEESEVTNVPLKDLKLKKDMLLCFISRNEKIIIPGGHDRILKGDTVMVVTKDTGFKDIKDILA